MNNSDPFDVFLGVMLGGWAIYLLFMWLSDRSKKASAKAEVEAYDEEYDRIVRLLIDGNLLELDGSHYVKAGLLRIWVENYPYRYGHPSSCGVSENLRLSTETKKMLHDHVNKLSVLKALEHVRGIA